MQSDVDFLEVALPHFQNEHYLKVDGAPVLLVYRVALLSDPQLVARKWRALAREAGYPDLYLVMAQTFGQTDPRTVGFDAAVEFPAWVLGNGSK